MRNLSIYRKLCVNTTTLISKFASQKQMPFNNWSMKKGLFSFYQDDHKECCGILKFQPLRKKLATLDGWITGQRKDQVRAYTN